MQKWISRFLLVILSFSLTFGSNNMTVKADTNEKNQVVQQEEKTESELQIEEESELQREINQSNRGIGIAADYNILHADEVSEAKSNGLGISTYSNSDLEVATNSSGHPLSSMEANMVVMLIDFPTSESDPNKGKVTVNKTYSEDQIESINDIYYGDSRSVKDYLNKVSKGECSVNTVFTYENNSEGDIYVYTAEHPIGYYLPYSSSNPIGYQNGYWDRTELFTDAFAALKKYIPSNLDLDLDNNGNIDSIVFFTPYCGAWNDFLWSHCWEVMDKTQSANGARLYYYTQITYPEIDPYVYQTVVHEYMHIIGFPDMYTYSDTHTFPNPFDSWTPMTYGTTGFPTVWERLRYSDNWVSESGIKTIEEDGTYSLSGSTTNSKSNTIAYKVEIPNSNEFFMIEYRNKNANIYEGDLSQSGIIAYRVNPNACGNSENDPELYQLRNQGQSCYEAYLNGTTGHKSLELKTYSGDSIGTIEFVNMSNGQASFKIDKKIEIEDIELRYDNAALVYNNQCTKGSIVRFKTTVGFAEGIINYTYKVKDSEGNVKTLASSNVDSSNYSELYWKAEEDGEYQFTVTAKDFNGNTSSKSVYLTVNDEITVKNSTIEPVSDRVIGNKITTSFEVIGGTGEKECLLITAYGNNKDYNFNMTDDFAGYWVPKEKGSYKIYATIRDKSECITKVLIGTCNISNGIEVTNISLKNGNGSLCNNETTLGNRVYLSSNVERQVGTVTYTYTAKDSEGNVTTIGSSIDPSVTWQPKETGKYVLTLSVKDSIGNTSSKSIDFTVNDKITLSSSTIDKVSPQVVGTKVNATVNVSGGTGEKKCIAIKAQGGNYQFGSREIYFKMTNNFTGYWIPDTDGTYTIYATVQDESGATTQFNLGEYKVLKNIQINSINLTNNNGSVCNNESTIGNRVKLSADVKNENGSVTYTYTVKDSKGNVTTLSSSTNSSVTWQPKETGNYVLTLSVKDSLSTVSKSIDFTVNDRIQLTSSNIDKVSPQVVGTKITAKVSVSGGTGDKKCIAMKAQGGNYQFGSRELYFTMTDDFTGYWIPDTDGDYNIYAVVQDEAGSTNQFKIGTYVVEKNVVTIYYSGYSNPYIHYQIGNGSWTQAPGVKMEYSSDVTGYNYKAEIDLGDAEKLTACFNNGNGSWDNNNRNNYSFTAGYYTLSNGTITKIAKPIKKLNVTSLTTNYPKGITGLNTVTINAEVENEEGDVTYTYTDIEANGTTKIIKSNTTSNSIYWTPSTFGKHTIKVTATDGITTSSKTIDFQVNDYIRATITGDEEISVGKAGKFTINATGGTGNLTYKFYYTNWPSTEKIVLQSSTNNTLTWIPEEFGSYQLWYSISDEGGYNRELGNMQVTVKERDEEETKTVIYYKGYSNPYIHYQIGNGSWTQAPGVKMDSSSDVTGYSYMIEIDLGDADKITACFNDGKGSWDNNNSKNYTFGSGYYTLSNGTITKIDKPTSELRIKSITCNKGENITYGDTATFTINAAGGSGDYTYSLSTTAYGSGRTLNLLANSKANSASWKPDYPRVINMTATVTDSEGNTVTYTETFNVKEVSENQITIYYKGYNNPYIHYKIGNGSWTAVPGIAMIATTEKSGYTHKIVIDLGDADNLTACFNNGNGSWDSNNGSNYLFNGYGTYTYSNGSINKIS